MVTDEERDYMYRTYAHDPQARVNLGIRRRLAPLLGNDRRKIELMNALLLAMPGTPVLYYGDEIGMGDNFYLGDRNGVRTPMQWSLDRNGGFSQANPQQLYLPLIIDPEYHYEAVNVETQQHNPHSLLWWMKRLISTRKRHKAFGRGSLEFLHPANRKVLAFIRCYQEERLLVVANLSHDTQCVELDLSAFQGMVPVELFGHTPFPPLGVSPYFLTLGAYACYWFALEPQHLEVVIPHDLPMPPLTVRGNWGRVFEGREKGMLEARLLAYLPTCRWFGGKARSIQAVTLTETIPVPHAAPIAYFTFVQVAYTEGEPETYVLPMTFLPDEPTVPGQEGEAALVRLRVRTENHEEAGRLIDAMGDKQFTTLLLSLIARGRRLPGKMGELTTFRSRACRSLLRSTAKLEPIPLHAEQSNTSVVYGDQFILKLYRRLAEGVNPDLEIGRYLTGCPPLPQYGRCGWSPGVSPEKRRTNDPGYPAMSSPEPGRCLDVYAGHPEALPGGGTRPAGPQRGSPSPYKTVAAPPERRRTPVGC